MVHGFRNLGNIGVRIVSAPIGFLIPHLDVLMTSTVTSLKPKPRSAEVRHSPDIQTLQSLDEPLDGTHNGVPASKVLCTSGS